MDSSATPVAAAPPAASAVGAAGKSGKPGKGSAPKEKPAAAVQAKPGKAAAPQPGKAAPAAAKPERRENKVLEGFRHLPSSLADADAPPPAPASLAATLPFLRLAAWCTSQGYVEATEYAARLVAAAIAAVEAYRRPPAKVRVRMRAAVLPRDGARGDCRRPRARTRSKRPRAAAPPRVRRRRCSPGT